MEAPTYCVDWSVNYQYWTTASDAREAAMTRLDPRRSPALHEFIGGPTLADDEVLAPRSVGVQEDAPAGLAEAAGPGEVAEAAAPLGIAGDAR